MCTGLNYILCGTVILGILIYGINGSSLVTYNMFVNTRVGGNKSSLPNISRILNNEKHIFKVSLTQVICDLGCRGRRIGLLVDKIKSVPPVGGH